MKNDALNTSTTEEMVTISRAEYEGMKALEAEHAALQEKYASLEAQVNYLMEQLRLIRHRQFGTSSERISEEGMEQLSLLFNEAEVYADEEKPEPTPVAAHVRRKRSGSVRDIVPENIPVVEVEHTLPEEERQCPQCGEVMEDIGTEVKETLKFKPAEAYIQRDVYHTYACRSCEKNDVSTPVVKTPKEPPLIPGGFASPEAVAHIAVQKFVMGSPLYRQEQELKRRNIFLSRQTMSNWLMWCTDNYLKYIYDELRRELVKHDLLHADETTLQVLHEPGKAPQAKSYMWLYRTSGDAEHPIVLYEYQPGRGQEYPKQRSAKLLLEDLHQLFRESEELYEQGFYWQYAVISPRPFRYALKAAERTDRGWVVTSVESKAFTDDRQIAEAAAELFTRTSLSPIHLEDAIKDYMSSL